MSITAPPALTPPPSPAPSRTDSANFSARSDLYHAWRVINSPQEAAALAWTYATAVEVYALATAAQTDRIAAQAAASAIAAQSPVANAAAAAASAAAAAAYASQAQATTPDSPIRLNPRIITADFTVPANYNAHSAGPIAMAEGVSVTLSNFSTWSIT